MRNPIWLLTVILVLLRSGNAMAKLGERVTGTAASALNSRAQKVSPFDIRESEVNGIQIKEFFSTDGVIFAVTWRGVAQPDLNSLLGDYFADYDQAAKQQLPSQRHGKSAVISSDQIVVSKFGHMRDIRGVAYVPSLKPAAVRIEDLQ